MLNIQVPSNEYIKIIVATYTEDELFALERYITNLWLKKLNDRRAREEESKKINEGK